MDRHDGIHCRPTDDQQAGTGADYLSAAYTCGYLTGQQESGYVELEHSVGHCAVCADEIKELMDAKDFIVANLRFVAIATPIILGIATFVILVTRS